MVVFFHDFILLDKYFRFAIFITFSYDWTEPNFPARKGAGFLFFNKFFQFGKIYIFGAFYKFY